MYISLLTISLLTVATLASTLTDNMMSISDDVMSEDDSFGDDQKGVYLRGDLLDMTAASPAETGQSEPESAASSKRFLSTAIKVDNTAHGVNGGIDVFCTITSIKTNLGVEKIMDCSSRRLTDVPSVDVVNITVLNLYNNSLSTLKDGAFRSYPMLIELILVMNKLSYLEIGCFESLTNLKFLNIKLNFLNLTHKTYPPGLFRPLENLKVLKMNRNTMDKRQGWGYDYPDSALKDLTKLETLYIDGLNGKVLGPGFAEMKSLRNLTMAGYAEGYCRLERLYESTFEHLSHVKMLNISDCYIIGGYLTNRTLSPLKNLTTLDLTYNINIGMEKLPVLLSGLRDSNLTHLYISSVTSRFSRSLAINASLVKSLPASLTYLVAKENCFETVDEDIFDLLPAGLRYIDLGNNRLLFGKYLSKLPSLKNLQFLQLSRDNYLYNLPTSYPFKPGYFEESSSLLSSSPGDNSEFGPPPFMLTLPPNLTTLQMKTAGLVYFLSTLHVNESNTLKELSIANNYFPKAYGPITGLNKLRYLDLSHCSLQMISENFFNQFPSLEKLILGNNYLYYQFSHRNRDDMLFKNLTKLTYLDLSNNRLQNLSENVLKGLDNLVKLHLETNRLTDFNIDISHMVNLTVLNLNNSQLTTLPVATRNHIDYLRLQKKLDFYVDMSLNPIHCDCLNLEFLLWMVKSPAFDRRFIKYQCMYQDSSIKYIDDRYEETITYLQRHCVEDYPVFMIVLAVTLALVATVIAGIAYRFRWKIRYIYYAAYLKMKKNRAGDQADTFHYDVFLSYSHKDEPFVLKELIPQLESRGLKVHVHGRDFAVGDYIASNIAAAVMNSRKTLAILTKELLKSHWCNYELQMANNEAIDTGRSVLVFLIKDTFSIDELGRSLLNHIRSNTYTTYPSGEQTKDLSYMCTFWDKLACDLKQ